MLYPAPLELRPYGAIHISLLLFIVRPMHHFAPWRCRGGWVGRRSRRRCAASARARWSPTWTVDPSSRPPTTRPTCSDARSLDTGRRRLRKASMRRTGVRLSVPYMFQTLMRSFEIYGVYSKLVARRQQRSASYGAIWGTRIDKVGILFSLL